MNFTPIEAEAERIFHDEWLPKQNTSGRVNLVYRLLQASGIEAKRIHAIERYAAQRAIDSLQEIGESAAHIENALSTVLRLGL